MRRPLESPLAHCTSLDTHSLVCFCKRLYPRQWLDGGPSISDWSHMPRLAASAYCKGDILLQPEKLRPETVLYT